ncbi:hypothetical protein OKW30_008242 [Paraburkholderia sp. Clong3]
MRTMQSQMNEIRQTQDPRARKKLLQKHWATMQSAMATMRGVWGPGMMGYGGMHHGMTGPGMMGGGWGHMGGYYSRLTQEQLRQRQYMTDQYLQMQEEMMNNMMWQQQYWMAPPPSPRPSNSWYSAGEFQRYTLWWSRPRGLPSVVGTTDDGSPRYALFHRQHDAPVHLAFPQRA